MQFSQFICQLVYKLVADSLLSIGSLDKNFVQFRVCQLVICQLVKPITFFSSKEHSQYGGMFHKLYRFDRDTD